MNKSEVKIFPSLKLQQNKTYKVLVRNVGPTRKISRVISDRNRRLKLSIVSIDSFRSFSFDQSKLKLLVNN